MAIYNRTADRAKNLADIFDVEFGGTLSDLVSNVEYDIVINTTPIGSIATGIDESAVGASFFREGVVAMDITTVPNETKFLKEAQAKGAKVVHGNRMLIHQALFQSELFTGQKAPLEVMERALLEAVIHSDSDQVI